MLTRLKTLAAFSIVILIAVVLRFMQLDNRPMHTDEAVQAIKFGTLLETNRYKYDPVEFHGPTLYYFTLLPALTADERSTAQLTETTLRTVPAFMGILLILFIISLRAELKLSYILITSFFTAVSSLMVFYNRYYVQESLLVCFNFCAIISFYKYFKHRKNIFLIAAGAFTGLAYATKETFIISVISGVLTLILLHKFSQGKKLDLKINFRGALIFLSVFIGIAVIFFSAFFTDAEGPLNSLAAFSNYFVKSVGNTDHIYPWYYYFELVLFRNINGFIFTEIVILFLFAAGIYSAFRNKNSNNLFRFISVYSLMLIIFYSAIPYKTPWLMMTFWQGILFTAGWGAVSIWENMRHSKGKIIISIFIIMLFGQQIYQTIKIVFDFESHPSNPFTYAQPAEDLEMIGKTLDEMEAIFPSENKFPVAVAAPKNDYWPLPWYLRKIPQVAWMDHVSENIHQFPLILASPELEDELIRNIYSKPPPGYRNLYLPLFDKYVELRPGVEFRGYARKDLLDSYLNYKP